MLLIINGTIKDLKLLNVNMYLDASNAKAQLGGICGQNSSAGVITNCIVSGNIVNKAVNGSTAGIAPYSSGSIQACGNLSNVSMEVMGENYNGTNNIDVRRCLWRRKGKRFI